MLSISCKQYLVLLQYVLSSFFLHSLLFFSVGTILYLLSLWILTVQMFAVSCGLLSAALFLLLATFLHLNVVINLQSFDLILGTTVPAQVFHGPPYVVLALLGKSDLYYLKEYFF